MVELVSSKLQGDGSQETLLDPEYFQSAPYLNVTNVFRFPTTTYEVLEGSEIKPLFAFDVSQALLPYSYSLQGDLPEGLVFDSQQGIITGIPTEAGQKIVKICSVEASVVSLTNCQDLVLSVVTERPIAQPIPVVSSNLCTSPSGQGTNQDPILIYDAEDFDTCLRHYPNRKFKLMADIDFNGYSYSQIPIFNGILLGNNLKLLNYSYSESLFNVLGEGALIKDLKIENFNITDATVIAGSMRGSIVKNVSFKNGILNLNQVYHCSLIANALTMPQQNPSYNGFIEDVFVENVTVNGTFMNGGFWTHCGGIVSLVLHTPFRISKVDMKNYDLTVPGNVATAIVGHNGTNGGWGPNPDISNLWIDQVYIDSNSSISGRAFTHSIIANPHGSDVISNTGSLAQINAGEIFSSGMSGCIEPNKSEPLRIVNSFFAGQLNGMAPYTMVGATYASLVESVQFINTASLDIPLVGVSGSPIATDSSHYVLSQPDFYDPNNSAFDYWMSNIWDLSVGTYPSLKY